ncbi:MAG: 3-dehydroquinate synthase [Nitrospinota bacterium]|nr:MAG: 3-dehydroquinate synthase [Nitrospinota bacterium]
MRTLRVHLGERSYDIHIDTGLLQRVGRLLAPYELGRNMVVCTDPQLRRLHGEKLLTGLQDSPFQVSFYEVPAGEEQKSLANAARLYDFLIEKQLDRRSPLLAFGGGVIGDLTGFVAATYLRGIPYIQVPTTLLAQVDSSVGGKTAVNHPRGKNLIGAFYQPRVVIIDILTLQTLPRREFLSGLAEVIKYGMIADAELFQLLEREREQILRLDPALLMRIVETCCQIKARVVEADEKEGGLRAILNFGHTIGHALEAASHYGAYTHGEAVAIGMVKATWLAVRLGQCEQEVLERLENLLQAYGLPTQAPSISPPAVQQALFLDKKVIDGRLRFVLPERIGQVRIRGDVPMSLVEEVIRL